MWVALCSLNQIRSIAHRYWQVKQHLQSGFS
jgi:hypothetical protein